MGEQDEDSSRVRFEENGGIERFLAIQYIFSSTSFSYSIYLTFIVKYKQYHRKVLLFI